MGRATLYDRDIVTWAEEQAAALRSLAKRPELSNLVDWGNLIEEIESMGRSQVSGVERKLVLILSHLLKVISAPDSPATRGWRSEIAGHQRVMRKQFSNAMRNHIQLAEVWSDAKAEARDSLLDWGDSLIRGLPDESPFGFDDLVSREFDVDRALMTISTAIEPRDTY